MRDLVHSQLSRWIDRRIPIKLFVQGKSRNFLNVELKLKENTSKSFEELTDKKGKSRMQEVGLDTIHLYNAAAIFYFKRGWTGIKIAKMANKHSCVPLCDNDRRYDNVKELSYFNFPSDKQKRKRTPSLEYTQVLRFCPSSLIPNPK